MPKNRYLPYGYQTINGRIAVNESEAVVVREIHQAYSAGQSYKVIADALTKKGIPYTPEKPCWNKNMVARMLQNRHYTGSDTYPAILDHSLATATGQARKPYQQRISRELRTLRPRLRCVVCGAPIDRRPKKNGGERWVCPESTAHLPPTLSDNVLLESVWTLQKQCSVEVKPSADTPDSSLERIRLENELAQQLNGISLDEANLQQTILTLAQTEYDATKSCGDVVVRKQIQRDPNRLHLERLLKIFLVIEVGEHGAIYPESETKNKE